MILSGTIRKDAPNGVHLNMTPAYRWWTEKNHGKIAWVSLSLNRPKRSIEQNKYYHGVICRMVSDFTGYTPDEVHEWQKANLAPVDKVRITHICGVETRSFSTTWLNTAEFAEWIEYKLLPFWQEQGCEIPLPNQ